MLDSLQTTKRANYWLIGVTLPLVALGVMFEQWYAFLIPPALFMVWLTLYRLDWAMWFVVLATPLSVTLEDLTGGSGLSVPTEPMLVLITFITEAGGASAQSERTDPVRLWGSTCELCARV